MIGEFVVALVNGASHLCWRQRYKLNRDVNPGSREEPFNVIGQRGTRFLDAGGIRGVLERQADLAELPTGILGKRLGEVRCKGILRYPRRRAGRPAARWKRAA